MARSRKSTQTTNGEWLQDWLMWLVKMVTALLSIFNIIVVVLLTIFLLIIAFLLKLFPSA